MLKQVSLDVNLRESLNQSQILAVMIIDDNIYITYSCDTSMMRVTTHRGARGSQSVTDVPAAGVQLMTHVTSATAFKGRHDCRWWSV